MNQGTRYEQALRDQERVERNKLIESRKFLETPETPSAFNILDAIKADPNVSPALRAVIRPTTLAERLAAKREEYDGDASGAGRWAGVE